MKVLRIITGSLNIGGTEKHLSMILPALAKQGWQIKIITLQASGEPNLLPIFEAAGIKVSTVNRHQFRGLPHFLRRGVCLARCFFKLWREFRRDRLTVTHCFLPQAYLLSMMAAFFARLPAVIVMSRRSLNYYQQQRPLLRWFELRCHRRVNYILGNSDRIIQQLHDEEHVPAYKLLKIYNGIDVRRYTQLNVRQTMRASLNIGEEDFVFVIVANLIPYKGHENLLQALSLIQEKLPSHWRLLCIGRDNGILSHLQYLAEKTHLTDHILWLGVREDVPTLLTAADVGILCSQEEGFSNAILECMATCLPMVVTDVGGNAEAVIHERTGLVVPANNSQALAQALLQLAENKTRAKAMGMAGQERVYKYFSLDACVAAYEKFYSDIILPEASKIKLLAS
jgi:glycosyltransferase involved in cell wall biosynthesis